MITDKNLICLNLEAQTKEEIMDALVELAYQAKKISDRQAYKQSLLKREDLGSTYMGNGLAIPHGISESVKEPFVAFARLSSEINWDHVEGQNVCLCFMIGVPQKNKDNMHLKILSLLCRKLVEETFLEKLMDHNITAEHANRLIRIEEEELL